MAPVTPRADAIASWGLQIIKKLDYKGGRLLEEGAGKTVIAESPPL